MNTQPEALRLADALETYGPAPWANSAHQAAAELRRLHEVNQELLEALKEMVSIVDIHQRATGNNFAWAEIEEARAAIAKGEQA